MKREGDCRINVRPRYALCTIGWIRVLVRSSSRSSHDKKPGIRTVKFATLEILHASLSPNRLEDTNRPGWPWWGHFLEIDVGSKSQMDLLTCATL